VYDGIDQHLSNGLVEPTFLLIKQCVGRTLWLDTCHEKGFVSIDIAHSGNKRLIKQQRLDHTRPTPKQGQEVVFSERVPQWFWTQPVKAPCWIVHQLHAPELALIIEP